MTASPRARLSLPAFGVVIVLLCAVGYFSFRDPGHPAPVTEGVANSERAVPGPGAAASAPTPATPTEDARQEVMAHAAEPSRPIGGVSAPSSKDPVGPVVRGRVVDARGAPVADAKVAVVTGTEAQLGLAVGLPRELIEGELIGVQTAADGSFAIGLETSGPFELVVTHEEHPRARQSGRADGPAVGDVLIVLRDGGSIAGVLLGVPEPNSKIVVVARQVEEGMAAATGSLRGALFDVGALIADMGVPIGARSAKPDEHGAFTLRGLEPGARFSLCATLIDEDAGNVRRCSEAVDVREGARGVELHWRETLTVELHVVDARSGAPLEELEVLAGPVRKVEMFGIASSVPMMRPIGSTTFPGGIVRVDDLDVGDADDPRIAISVRAAGHRSWSRDDIRVPVRGRADLGIASLAAATRVHVLVTAQGRALEGAEVSLRRADPKDGAGPAPRGLRFTTKVTRHDGEGDHEGAVVQDPESSSAARRTDAEGRAELTADFDGDARLLVAADGFASFRSDAFSLPAEGLVDKTIDLRRGGSLHVVVLDGQGAPAPGVGFVCRHEGAADQDFTSDERGEATIEHLAAGEYRLELAEAANSGIVVRIDGAANRSGNGGVSAVVTEGGLTEVELRQPLRCSLTGIVTLDGQPLDRAEVRTLEPGGDSIDTSKIVGAALGPVFGGLLGGDDERSGKTDDDGRYELEGIPIGARRVVVTHRDLAMPSAEDVVLVEGENRRDIALRTTSLEGRVLGSDGAPIEGVSVGVARDEQDADQIAAGLAEAGAILGEMFGGGSSRDSARTDSEGRFELRGVQPEVGLRVRAWGKSWVADSVRVDPIAVGTARDGVELRLAVAGRVRVRAVIDGAMLVKAEWAGGDVEPKGDTRHTALLRSGRAVLDSMPPGRWRLTLEGAAKEQLSQHERFVDVVAGQLANVEF